MSLEHIFIKQIIPNTFMSEKSRQDALYFINNETQFHLGFLPTEQSNPITRGLDKRFAESVEKGVSNLQEVDRNVLAMCTRIFAGPEFKKLADTIETTIRSGKRVVFSGCGATGRLSILLESMWRDAVKRGCIDRKYAESVFSIMTGGDFALIRSVEFFEDYCGFGGRQVQMLDLRQGDTLVAITEGGETSSVLGSLYEALERGLNVFLMFNNPADLLAERIERSRKAIRDPRVTVLDLSCGPMALAGSTRMQATTSEQLVAGAALETAAFRLAGNDAPDYTAAFKNLLEALEAPACVKAIADYIRFESGVYKQDGKLTYFADRFLLDIFTDTTERTPTFMLPPFRKANDKISQRPWTFVKNPLFSTEDTWAHAMNRPLRCLNWTSKDLAAMGAPEAVACRPPAITADDMVQIHIGNEDIDERCETAEDAAVLVTIGAPAQELADAYAALATKFGKHSAIDIRAFGIAAGQSAPLELMDHMAIKLILNTVSTGVMVILGRVTSNWMSWVDCTNKKLLDRGTRLVCEIGGLDYQESCIRLFDALEEIAKNPPSEGRVSAVQYVLNRL